MANSFVGKSNIHQCICDLNLDVRSAPLCSCPDVHELVFNVL